MGILDVLVLPASAWLLTYLVHSTVLLGAAWLLTRRLTRSEALKETLWKTALVGAIGTATLQGVLGWAPLTGGLELASTAVGSVNSANASAARQPESRRVGLDEAAPAGASAEVTEPTGDVATRTSSPLPTVRDRLVPGPGVLLASWLVVALALLLRLGLRHVRLQRLLCDRRQLDEGGLAAALAELRRNAGLWRPVWLSASPRCPSPLALGTREICVPERFVSELEPEEQRAGLAHELAHLARRDPLWHVLAGVIESVFFFQPLNRVARLRLRESAEYLCDDWAVRQTGSQLGLARCLAQVASWVGPVREPVPSGTMAMAEGGSPLLLRVQRLLDGRTGEA
ncbi:MAG: M56 family metallopeptidase, partial [Longimicrobiales bacterium]